MQTLATIAGATFGRSDIGPYTQIMSNAYAQSNADDGEGKCCAERNTNGSCITRRACTDCEDWYKNYYGYNSSTIDNYMASTDKIICLPGNIPRDTSGSAIGSISGNFWSASEVSSNKALERFIFVTTSNWVERDRLYNNAPLCVGD